MKNRLLVVTLLLIFAAALYGVNFGVNKVQAQKIEWTRMSTLHFDIYYPKGEDTFGQTCALLAEEAYYYLRKDFWVPLEWRIPVIFYSTQRQFSTTNIIYPLLSEGVGGFTEYEKNRVVVPFDGSYKKLEEVLVHELTHAYVRFISTRGRGRLVNLPRNLPFWFSEGLPEFEAVGGTDVYNNMFIMDMVLNDSVRPLQSTGGYYAYRMGEAFLVWLGKEYGRKSVMDLYEAFASERTEDRVEERFKMSFDELQQLWVLSLKRQWNPWLNRGKVPTETYKAYTDHTKNNSQQNVSPRLSPDGSKLAWFSDRYLRTGIWLKDFAKKGDARCILEGEETGQFEEFHFQRSNLAWFSDNTRLAFVAKTFSHDNIYVLDNVTREIDQVIEFADFSAIYELDVSPDGSQIVFSGQRHTADDIYIYNLQTKQTTAITQDRYHDAQPRWSADGKQIIFCSERGSNPADSSHVFYGLNKDIYTYSLPAKTFTRLTNTSYDEAAPMWLPNSDLVAWLDYSQAAVNYKVMSLSNNQTATLTSVLSGVLSADIVATPHKALTDTTTVKVYSKKAKPKHPGAGNPLTIALASFYNGGWDIYAGGVNPDTLSWQAAEQPALVDLPSNFEGRFNLERFKLYGKQKREFVKGRHRAPMRRVGQAPPDTLEVEQLHADSLVVDTNRHIDKRPNGINTPVAEPYHSSYSIDRIWGGMAYASSIGMVGYLQMGMSDLMGNRAIGLQTSLSGDLQESNFIATYLMLENRLDYGFGAFHVNTADAYTVWYSDGSSLDIRDRERRWGAYLLLRYPFNKFWRVELENTIFAERDYYQTWQQKDSNGGSYYDFDQDGDWKTGQMNSYLAYNPRFSLVHDNALNASTGPISGWKGILSVEKSFDFNHETKYYSQNWNPALTLLDNNQGKNYYTVSSDLRFYALFAHRYALALRVAAASSMGPDPEKFELDFWQGFRGYTDDRKGTKRVISSLELRYPFLDRLQIPFPVPLSIGNVRGSIFVDAAALWNNNSELELTKDGRLKDMYMSFGFGPRANLGFVIVKLDIAWETDLVEHGRPKYFFSLWQDF